MINRLKNLLKGINIETVDLDKKTKEENQREKRIKNIVNENRREKSRIKSNLYNWN